MENLNIFETYRRTTSKTERLHSQFLADVLDASLKGDRSLFDAVWKLIAPSDWDAPDDPEVEPEDPLESGRIDISIIDKSKSRVVGVEVKTEDDSASMGQLKKYQQGLKVKYGDSDIAIAYLTPFNRKHAGDSADSLSTVKEFEKFSKEFNKANHVSWRDVADISWDDNELWKQHQVWVRENISSGEVLTSMVSRKSRKRSFYDFFGQDAADSFWSDMALMGVDHPDENGVTIDLRGFKGSPQSLARAFERLIEDGEDVRRQDKRPDKFEEKLREQFVESRYHEFHDALFYLSQRFGHVWLQGTEDYGLRVAHSGTGSGVSLVTSKGPRRLINIGQLK